MPKTNDNAIQLVKPHPSYIQKNDKAQLIPTEYSNVTYESVREMKQRSSNHLLDWPPLYRWVSTGWCVQTEPCSSLWCHTEEGTGRWCPGHTGSSAPSNTWSRPDDPASGGRRPACRSSRSPHSANVWLWGVWKTHINTMNNNSHQYKNIGET